MNLGEIINLYKSEKYISIKYLKLIKIKIKKDRNLLFKYIKEFIIYQNKDLINICLKIFYNFHENDSETITNLKENRYSILTYNFYKFYCEENLDAIFFLIYNYREGVSEDLGIFSYDYVSDTFINQLYLKLTLTYPRNNYRGFYDYYYNESFKRLRMNYDLGVARWRILSSFQITFINMVKNLHI